MKRLITKLTIGITGLILIFATSGCRKDDEPTIVVPEPTPAAPTISGTISTNGQDLLSGAAVTAIIDGKTYTATSDANGAYSIQVEKEGICVVTAKKDGYTSAEGLVETVKNGVNVWNAILQKPITKKAPISASAETTVEVPIQPLLDSKVAAEDTLKMKFATESVEKDDELIVEIIYGEPIWEQSKASNKVSLLAVKYWLSKGKLNKEITISIDAPAKPDELLLNGKEVKNVEFEGNQVKISADTTGTLVLNYNVDITENVSGSEVLQFDQTIWDNFNGTGEMRVLNPKYTLKTGGVIVGKSSLLNSYAATYTGVPAKSSLKKEYPLDLTLPVGGKLVLEGKQAINKYVFKLANLTSEVAVYESAYITATTYNKQHTGGSN